MFIRYTLLALLVCLVSLILGLTLLLLSPSIGKYLANTWLPEPTTQISCLDYRYQWPAELLIDKACYESAELGIEVQQANYHLLDNWLTVKQLEVHIHADSAHTSEVGFSLPWLPTFLPGLKLQRVIVRHSSLLTPLQLSVTQTSPHRFVIQDGWRLELHAFADKLTGELQANLSDFMRYLPSQSMVNLAEVDSTQTIRGTFELVGSRFLANLQIPELWPVTLPLEQGMCQFDYQNLGDWQLQADLEVARFSLDATAVSMSIDVKSCPAIAALEMPGVRHAVSMLLPEPVHYQQGLLKVPKLLINSVDNDSLRIQASELVADNLVNGSGQFDIALRPFQSLHGTTSFGLRWSQNGVVLQSNDILLSADALSYQGANINQLQADATLQYSTLEGLQVNTRLQLQGASFADVVATNMTQTLSLASAALDELHISANTQVGELSVMQASVGMLELAHKLHLRLPSQSFSGEHKLRMLDDVMIDIRANNKGLTASVSPYQASLLTPVFQSLIPEISFDQGRVSAQLRYVIDGGLLDGEVSLENLAGSYGEYKFSQLNTVLPFSFDSAGLQLAKARLSINSIDIGIPIDNLVTQISSHNSEIRLDALHAEVFAGEISLAEFVLSPARQALLLQLTDIELGAIMAVQQQAGVVSEGIEISGAIKGRCRSL